MEEASEVQAAVWWTHATLNNEAAAAPISAAEVAAARLDEAARASCACIVKALCKDRSVKDILLFPREQRQSWSTMLNDRMRLHEHVGSHLTSLRKALLLSWIERQRAASTEDPSNQHVSGQAGGASEEIKHLLGNRRAAQQLREMQRQGYLSLWTAIAEGIAAGVKQLTSDHENGGDDAVLPTVVVPSSAAANTTSASVSRMDVLYALCMDALLADIYCSAIHIAESPPTGTPQRWGEGFVQELRETYPNAEELGLSTESGTSSLAPSSVYEANLLVSYLHAFIFDAKLGLSPCDYFASFPLLVQCTRRHVELQLNHLADQAGRVRRFVRQSNALTATPLVLLQRASSFFQQSTAGLQYWLDCRCTGSCITPISASTTRPVFPPPSFFVADSVLASPEYKNPNGCCLPAPPLSCVPFYPIYDYGPSGSLFLYLLQWLKECRSVRDAVLAKVGPQTTNIAPSSTTSPSDVAADANEEEGAVDEVAAARQACDEEWKVFTHKALSVLTLLYQGTGSSLVLLRTHVELASILFGEEGVGNQSSPTAMRTLEVSLHHLSSKSGAVLTADDLRAGGGGEFPVLCFSRLESVFSAAMDGVFLSSSSQLWSGATPEVSPLAISLLHYPIATLQRLMHLLLSMSTATARCSVEDSVVESATEQRGKGYTENPLGGHDVASGVFFAKYYRLFRSLEVAAKFIVARLLAEDEEHGTTAVSCRGSSDSPEETHRKRIVEIMSIGLVEALERCLAKGGSDAAGAEALMFFAFVGSSTPIYPVESLELVRRAVQISFAPGAKMMAFLERHIVQKHRWGLAAFFLPLMRAIGVDHTAAINYDHLAIALPYPYASEVTYLSELPRGYFCRMNQKLSLNLKNDALAYLQPLLFGDVFPPQSGVLSVVEHSAQDAFLSIVAAAGVEAARRAHGGGVEGETATTCQSTIGTDSMSALFYSVLRLCHGVAYWKDDLRHQFQRLIVARMQSIMEPSMVSMVELSSLDSAVSWSSFLHRGLEPVLSEPASTEEENPPCKSLKDASAWLRWFWCGADYNILDEHPSACVKVLLRNCSTEYRQIPTATLARQRSLLKEYSQQQRVAMDACLSAMQEAIRKDVEVLRSIKTPEASSTTPSPTADEESASPSPASPVTEEAPPVIDVPAPPLHEQQALPHQREYFSAIFFALLQRARISPVDGATSGAALIHLFAAMRDLVEPSAMVKHLERFSYLLGKALQSTTLVESRSISILLYYLIEYVALPFKKSFLRIESERLAVEPTTADGVGLVPPFLLHALGNNEADAVRLLSSVMREVQHCLHLHLTRRTTLADWCAYNIGWHSRRVLRLVARYDASFRKDLVDRRVTVNRTGIVSTGLDLLMQLERPLGEGMASPVSEVAFLFTRKPPPTPATPRAAASPIAGNGGKALPPPHRPQQPAHRSSSSRGERRSGGGHKRGRR